MHPASSGITECLSTQVLAAPVRALPFGNYTITTSQAGGGELLFLCPFLAATPFLFVVFPFPLAPQTPLRASLATSVSQELEQGV